MGVPSVVPLLPGGLWVFLVPFSYISSWEDGGWLLTLESIHLLLFILKA